MLKQGLWVELQPVASSDDLERSACMGAFCVSLSHGKERTGVERKEGVCAQCKLLLCRAKT